MSLLIASSLVVSLTFGGLSTSNPVYQRAIAIGNFAGKLAGESAAAAENGCMSGVPLDQAKVSKALLAGKARLASYWTATRNADQSGLAANFDPKGGRWTLGATDVAISATTRVADPLSGAGAVLAQAPVSFTVAGDGDSAIGQWEVSSAKGTLLGTYQVRLRKQSNAWLIAQMEIVPAEAFVEPLIRYCHAPGDIINHLMANAKTSVEVAEKELAEKLVKEKASRGTPKEEAAQRRALEASRALENARREKDLAMAKIVAIQQERSSRKATFEATRR